MQYPESLKQQKINGITTIGFIVEVNGSVSHVEIVKESGYKEFDDEAVRLVENFPTWKPAQKDCNDVEFKMQIDIVFNCEKCGCNKK
jgi:TonB family protein